MSRSAKNIIFSPYLHGSTLDIVLWMLTEYMRFLRDKGHCYAQHRRQHKLRVCVIPVGPPSHMGEMQYAENFVLLLKKLNFSNLNLF